MAKIPTPIFADKLRKISWQKIYAREYGVSYSEGAILCLSNKFKYHIPKPTADDVVIPQGNNSAFYVDATSWEQLVESLNQKYTSHTKALKQYELGFTKDGEKYLKIARKINKLDLKKLSNSDIKKIYFDYQEKLLRYSVYAWTSFILNNYIAEKATQIIDRYIKKTGRENEKQEIYNSLFHPTQKAAILNLQSELQKHKRLTTTVFNNLYEKYKWLSCLDIHNDPWTRKDFANNIEPLRKNPPTRVIPFKNIINKLKISPVDLDYLLMAQKFVYIKDARDDYRRQSVYHALPFFAEIGRRMGIARIDVSYLKQAEIIGFFAGQEKISSSLIGERKRGFIVYLDKKETLVCLQGNEIKIALREFRLLKNEKKELEIVGRIASSGKASGRVVIVRGVKDLGNVNTGDILVAVTTHPDYVPAMRKAAAIITDEGGITSHAAIVSREFSIPCIVGTKHATSILKDGDQIEVNAVEGKITQRL